MGEENDKLKEKMEELLKSDSQIQRAKEKHWDCRGTIDMDKIENIGKTGLRQAVRSGAL